MVLFISGCLSLALAGACHDDLAGPRYDVLPQGQHDTTLAPVADTYIRQGSPNQNQGTETILRLQSSGHNRALLRWDPQAIAAAVGTGTLVSARIELTITDNGENWGIAGRALALHRLTQPWTEAGATWNCAIDAIPTNQSPNCTGTTAWEMGSPTSANPFVPTPTAMVVIHTGQSGVVSFDVTGDVASGQTNGWILKKVDEGQNGRVDFASREGTLRPRLALTLSSGGSGPTWPVLVDYPILDSSRLVQTAGESPGYVYRTDISLFFGDSVTDSMKAAFFQRMGMMVTGVTVTGRFFVRIPDPGPSVDDLYAALDAIRAEPEVRIATVLWYSPLREQELSRFPQDGLGHDRLSWFGTLAATWASRAIRSPLAWGCETGDYGGTVPAVGILEFKFYTDHPELTASVPALRQPTDASLLAYAIRPPDTVANKRAHAIATTGLLTARGDNGSGIAGVVWRSRLFAYAAYSQSNRPLPLTSGLSVLLNRMLDDDIRVLSISVDAVFNSNRPGDQQAEIEATESEFELLLRRLPSLLIVVAAGNDKFLGSVAAYQSFVKVGPLRSALLRLRSRADFANRIVIVAGTRAGNRFWDSWPANTTQGSNFFNGVTDVAAPAEDVAVLGPWSGQTGSAVPTATQTGTSLAAPLVAGVAAQLLTMDSTLSPAQVKDYIIRGSRVARRNAQTGVVEQHALVVGAPEPIYELDAYGALSLLSAERPGTPICGFPVSLGVNAVGNFDSTVVLERPVQSERIRVPGNHGSHEFSVAQGGRLISVRDVRFPDAFTMVQQSVLMDHRGSPRGVVPNTFRRFLERDTLDQDLTDPAGTTFFLKAQDTARSRTVTPVAAVAGSMAPDCSSISAFAPDGLRYYVSVSCPDPLVSGQYYVSLDGGTFRVAGYGWDPIWTHDSRHVVALTADGFFENVGLETRTGAGALVTRTTALPPNLLLTDVAPDDIVYQSQDVTMAGADEVCQSTVRLVGTQSVVDTRPLDCFLWGVRPRFPNLMASVRDGQHRSAAWSLADPLRVLIEQRGAPLQARAGLPHRRN